MLRSRLFVVLLSLAALAFVATPLGADVGVGPGGGAPGTSLNFELVGHNPLGDRGMNAAIAVFEDVAYVGNRTDGSSTCGRGDPRRDEDDPNTFDDCPHPDPGIQIVDISDPADPTVVGEIGPPDAGNDGETTRELRVWPEKELLMVLTFRCSPFIHACSGASVIPEIRFFDLSDPLDPQRISTYRTITTDGRLRTPHEFALWVDPDDPDRALLWLSLPTLSTNPDVAQMAIVDISAVPEGGETELVAEGNWNQLYPGSEDPANFDFNLALHSMTPTVDGTTTHLAYLSGHYLILDTSEVADGTEPGEVVDLDDALLTQPEDRPTWDNPNPGHSAIPLPGRPFALVTDEVYGTFTFRTFGCPWGWSRLITTANPAQPKIIGEYKIAENEESFCGTPEAEPFQERTSFASHNPTALRNLVFISWHSGGLQAVDVSDPGAPTQAGWFSPEPLAEVANEDPALSAGPQKVVMWSFPIIKDGLIYVVDVRNGLYVLRYTGPDASRVDRISFLEGNSNLGDAIRLDKSAKP